MNVMEWNENESWYLGNPQIYIVLSYMYRPKKHGNKETTYESYLISFSKWIVLKFIKKKFPKFYTVNYCD